MDHIKQPQSFPFVKQTRVSLLRDQKRKQNQILKENFSKKELIINANQLHAPIEKCFLSKKIITLGIDRCLIGCGSCYNDKIWESK